MPCTWDFKSEKELMTSSRLFWVSTVRSWKAIGANTGAGHLLRATFRSQNQNGGVQSRDPQQSAREPRIPVRRMVEEQYHNILHTPRAGRTQEKARVLSLSSRAERGIALLNSPVRVTESKIVLRPMWPPPVVRLNFR